MAKSTEKKLIEQVRATYNAIAEDFSATRTVAWPEFERILPYLRGRILDVGCGNGRFFGFLPLELHAQYVGLDFAENLVKIAQKHFPSGKFVVGDFLALPDGPFEVVVAIASFHHLPSVALRREALAEMRRILSDDGDLFLTVWNLDQPKYAQYIDENRDSFIPWGEEKVPRYYYAFREAELRALVEEAGFEVLEFATGNNFFLHARKG